MAENENIVTEEVTEEVPTIEELQAQIQALTDEKEKLKQAISASNSDASRRKKEAQEWQDKYKSTLDEQKRKEFEAEEQRKRLDEELANYKVKERISTYKSKLMSAGFDEATAESMATSLPDGVEDTFFESQKAFIEATKQTVKTQLINSQPDLSVGMPPSTNESNKENDDLRRWFGL